MKQQIIQKNVTFSVQLTLMSSVLRYRVRLWQYIFPNSFLSGSCMENYCSYLQCCLNFFTIKS